MSANLYDLLDVDEQAGPDEIRAAWKAAIADLDPTERRFRAYNDAAALLLDPDRRAAYDAQLQAEREAEAAEAAAAEAAEAEAAEAAAVEASAAAEVPEPVVDEPEEREELAVVVPDAGPGGSAPDLAAEPEPEPGRGPAGWLFGAVGLAAVLAVALAIWMFTLPGVRSDTSPRAAAQRAITSERAGLDAEGAAEQMVGPVLSYNHQTMAADLTRLQGYLTKKMDAKQTAAWPQLTTEAEAQEIVVEASSAGAALTRTSADGRRATVVVFIDQAVTKKGAQPFNLQMWATMELVKSADGPQGWLLDDLCTDSSCG